MLLSTSPLSFLAASSPQPPQLLDAEPTSTPESPLLANVGALAVQMLEAVQMRVVEAVVVCRQVVDSDLGRTSIVLDRVLPRDRQLDHLPRAAEVAVTAAVR